MAIQMLDRLREAEENYLHLEASLSAPDIAANPTKLASVMKEYKSLTPLITAYRACLDAEKRIEEALQILEETTDAEIMANNGYGYAVRFAKTAARFRDKLIERYGEEKGRRIRYAEAFELCPYGGQHEYLS